MYKVILINQVQGGFVLEEAKRLLAERVKLTEKQLEKILSSSNYAVLKTDKRELANRVAEMIHSCGFSAEVISNSTVAKPVKPLVWSQNDQQERVGLSAVVDMARLLRTALFRKAYGLTALLCAALLVMWSAAGLWSSPTLEDAADYALDSMLLSGEPISADLQTRFARQGIRACFHEKVSAWNPDNYELYIESLNRLRHLKEQPYQMLIDQRMVEEAHPAVFSVVVAGLNCPEEFMLN